MAVIEKSKTKNDWIVWRTVEFSQQWNDNGTLQSRSGDYTIVAWRVYSTCTWMILMPRGRLYETGEDSAFHQIVIYPSFLKLYVDSLSSAEALVGYDKD